jgi:DNA polymerase I-like protein with 3'-5' exonuclease and polymerase domains
MIVAPPGKVLVSCDLSQAESWIVAFRANEPNMKRALQFGDIHTETAGNALFHAATGCAHTWNVVTDGLLWRCPRCAREVTKLMRYVGKRYNHASAYRMGAERAAQVINKDSDKPPYFTVTVRQSKQFSTSWHSYYNLKTWWSDIERQLYETRSLTTCYGRKRIFFAAIGNELWKEATAFEPQSTVADHFNGHIHPQLGIRGGLLEIYRKLVKPYKDRCVINQSHDSFIAEVPISDGKDFALEAKALLQRPMVIGDDTFTIPTDAEMGDRWGELERVA